MLNCNGAVALLTRVISVVGCGGTYAVVQQCSVVGFVAI